MTQLRLVKKRLIEVIFDVQIEKILKFWLCDNLVEPYWK